MTAVTSALGRFVRPRLLPIGWLTLVWVMLWGRWSWGDVLNGVLIAFAVTIILPLPKVVLGGSPHLLPILGYLTRFAVDLVRGSILVAWQAVRPAPVPVSSIIGVRLHSRSELVMVVLMETISLTPGTLAMELDAEDRMVYIHMLDAPDASAVEAERVYVLALEQRLIAALGGAQDFDVVDVESPSREERR